ncbi:hypothetical protein [Hymenobacter fodinae]|uniref:Uncharacterized protein n=1 Tax=Hymenobacter fodinae TaxID=2510796 RepID=A0A4Z0P9W1_9BACT|nr:hypothetical protein [Hymenobacter fodinae]TGE08760.1 hypothetical protein EU556_13825 [Hymenobacter fodinae]
MNQTAPDLLQATAFRALGGQSADGGIGAVLKDGAPVGSFTYGTNAQATLDDNLPTPQIQLYPLTASEKPGTDRVERYDAAISFLTSVEGLGDDRPGLNAGVAEMRRLKDKFMSELDRHPLVEITEVRSEEVRNAQQAMLTGISVAFTIAVPALATC